MQNQSQIDEMFEKFREHCRDSTLYNLKSIDEIIAAFNKWQRAEGFSQDDDDDGTPDVPSEELLRDLVPEDLTDDDEDGWETL